MDQFTPFEATITISNAEEMVKFKKYIESISSIDKSKINERIAKIEVQVEQISGAYRTTGGLGMMIPHIYVEEMSKLYELIDELKKEIKNL